VLQPQLEYIYQAEVNLPSDDPWLGTADQMRTEHLAVLKILHSEVHRMLWRV